MLLVLSEAVAHELPGEDPRHQASAALRLLDRAAAVHAPTPTYHLRRAACLERLGDVAAARLERERAGGSRRSTRSTTCCSAARSSAAATWTRRGPPSTEALRQRPESFWARCLLADAEL